MLRRTSKSVKEQVDKMRLPAVVNLCELWNKEGRGRGFQEFCRLQKIQIVMKELPLMTAWCRITTLKLTWLGLAQNDLEHDGTIILARVLREWTNILARVLGECPALTTLHLQYNGIGCQGARSLARVLHKCTALTELNLAENHIGDSGVESIAAVLGQCPALKILDVEYNEIGDRGISSLVAASTATLQLDTMQGDEEEDEEEEEEEDTSDVDSEEEDEDEAEEEPHSD